METNAEINAEFNDAEQASYDVHAVEEKWQQVWEDLAPFRADDDSPREKRYALTMFPYPSGDLHICLLYTSPSPRDGLLSRMPSSA